MTAENLLQGDSQQCGIQLSEDFWALWGLNAGSTPAKEHPGQAFQLQQCRQQPYQTLQILPENDVQQCARASTEPLSTACPENPHHRQRLASVADEQSMISHHQHHALGQGERTLEEISNGNQYQKAYARLHILADSGKEMIECPDCNGDQSVCSEDAEGSSYAGTPPPESHYSQNLNVLPEADDTPLPVTTANSLQIEFEGDVHEEASLLAKALEQSSIDPLTQLALVATSGAMEYANPSSKRRASPQELSPQRKRKIRKISKTTLRISSRNVPQSSSFVPHLPMEELLKDQDCEDDIRARSVRAELERKADLDYEQDMFEFGQRERNRLNYLANDVDQHMTPSKRPFQQESTCLLHEENIYKPLEQQYLKSGVAQALTETESILNSNLTSPFEAELTSSRQRRESTAQTSIASETSDPSMLEKNKCTEIVARSIQEEQHQELRKSQESCWFFTFDDRPQRLDCITPIITKVQEAGDELHPELSLTPRREPFREHTLAVDDSTSDVRQGNSKQFDTSEVVPNSPCRLQEAMQGDLVQVESDGGETTFATPLDTKQYFDVANQVDLRSEKSLVNASVQTETWNHQGAAPRLCTKQEAVYSQLSSDQQEDLVVDSCKPSSLNCNSESMNFGPFVGSLCFSAPMLPSTKPCGEAQSSDIHLVVVNESTKLSAITSPALKASENGTIDVISEIMTKTPSTEIRAGGSRQDALAGETDGLNTQGTIQNIEDSDSLMRRENSLETTTPTQSPTESLKCPKEDQLSEPQKYKRRIPGLSTFQKMLAKMPEADREIARLAMEADCKTSSVSMRRRHSRSVDKVQDGSKKSVTNLNQSETSSLTAPKDNSIPARKTSKRSQVDHTIILTAHAEQSNPDRRDFSLSNRVTDLATTLAPAFSVKDLKTSESEKGASKTRLNPKKKASIAYPPFQKNLRSRK